MNGVQEDMKTNTDSVKKEIFRNNNDMKRESKKSLDGLDAKLSKIIQEIRLVVDAHTEAITIEKTSL